MKTKLQLFIFGLNNQGVASGARGSAVVAALFINIKMKNYGHEKCNIFRHQTHTHRKKNLKKNS